MKSVYYFNSGSVLIFIIYVLMKKEWSRKNEGDPPEMGKDLHRRKVLFRKWGTNEFDWVSTFILLGFIVIQVCIYLSILYSFKIA